MKKLLLAIALLAFSQPLHAQNDLGSLVNEALKAMNEGKWEEALEVNTKAVGLGQNPKMAIQLYGPQFGVIWFRKGVCELKLNKFEEAAASFEACYKDFPNDKNKGGRNIFNKMAL